MSNEPQTTPKEDREQTADNGDELTTVDLIHIKGTSIEPLAAKSALVIETTHPEVPKTLRDEALERWEVLIRQQTNPNMLTKNLIELANAHAQAGNKQEAIRVLESTKEPAGSEEISVPERIRFGAKIGVALHRAGENSSALGFLLGSRKFLEDSCVGDWREADIAEKAVEDIAVGLAEIGEIKEALAIINLPLKHSSFLGGTDVNLRARLKTKVAQFQIQNGDRDGGLATLDKALEDARDTRNFFQSTDQKDRLMSISSAFLNAGEIERAIEVAREPGVPLNQLANIAKVVALKNNVEYAMKILKENFPKRHFADDPYAEIAVELIYKNRVEDAVRIAAGAETPDGKIASLLRTVLHFERTPNSQEKINPFLAQAEEIARNDINDLKLKIRALRSVGIKYSIFGFTDKARELYEEAQRLEPHEPQKPWQEMELPARKKYAIESVSEGKIDLALDVAATLGIDAVEVYKRIAESPTSNENHSRLNQPALPPVPPSVEKS